MTTRVKILEFGIIQKALANAVVTFYLTDDEGANSGVKADLYQAATGSDSRANPQTLDEDGKLTADCYVGAGVMATITGISSLTERTIKKVKENPLEFSLASTSAKYFSQAGADLYGDLSEIDAAVAAVQAVLADAGFVAVSTDLLGVDHIGTVAGSIASVNTAASNITSINTVAAANTAIGTVATNIVAVSAVGTNIAAVLAVNSNATNINAVNANSTNINTVAGDHTAINTVAGDHTAINTVATDHSIINTVSTNIASVNTAATGIAAIVICAVDLAGTNSIGTVASNIATILSVNSNSANINSAVANATNINAAVANATNINAVVANATNINTVAADVTNINTVATDHAIISTVASDHAVITTVAGISAAITTLSGLSSQITTLALISADITAAANNIPKANRTAITNPAVGNDSTQGYSEASIWVNTATNSVYFCGDAGVGAAVWIAVTAGATIAGLSDVTLTGIASGDMLKYNGSVWINRTAANTRTDLGLVIGTNVQAQDAELAALAGLTSAADKLPYFTGSGTAALADFTAGGRALVNSAGTSGTFPYFSSSNTVTLGTVTAFALTLIDDANQAAARTTLGLTPGTDVQAQDAELAAIAGLTSAADRLPYFTGSGTAALATFTAGGRALVNSAGTSGTFPYFSGSNTVTLGTITASGLSILDDASVSAIRTTLGSTTVGDAVFIAASTAAARTAIATVIGTDVQAYDAELAAYAGLTSAANKLGYFTGSGTMATTDYTAGARSIDALASYTKGDLIGFSASDTAGKLAVGTDAFVLTADAASSLGFKWAAAPSPLGGATESTSSSAITLTSASNRVLAWNCTTAGLYVKLPDATTMSAGALPFVVKNTGTYAFPVIDAGTPGQAIAWLQPGDGCMIYVSNIATAKGKWYCGMGDMGNMTEIINGTTANNLNVENSNHGTYYAVARIDDSRFLWVWNNSNATATLKCAVITITNAETLSAGAVATIVTLASIAHCTACPLDSSNVAVCYAGTSVNSVIVIGISGTTATPGTPTSVVATTSGNLHAFKISSTSIFYAYVTSTTSKAVVISAMSTAGNTINSVTTCRASTTSDGNLSVAQADVNTYFFATCGTSSFLDAQLVTVSSVTVTANTALANASGSTTIGAAIQTIALSTSFFLTVYTTGTAANMHWVAHRVSTGTTLEVCAGSNGAAGVASYGFIRSDPSGASVRIGAVLLNGYAVFIYSTTNGGSYGVPMFIHFKVNALLKTASLSHMSFGDANIGTFSFANSGQSGTSATLMVSPGKIIGALGAQTGNSFLNPYIIHGITNP